jgi:hypothetical protein
MQATLEASRDMRGGASEPRVPPDLRKALSAALSVEALWSGLTPIGRRDFISWIDSAKQPVLAATPDRESLRQAYVREATPLLLCSSADESLHGPRRDAESESPVESSHAGRAQGLCQLDRLSQRAGVAQAADREDLRVACSGPARSVKPGPCRGQLCYSLRKADCPSPACNLFVYLVWVYVEKPEL